MSPSAETARRSPAESIFAYQRDYWRAFCSQRDGAAFHEDPDATWFTTGDRAAPWYNQVMETRFAPGDTMARVDRLLASFGGLPMFWHVDVAATPDVPGVLADRGLSQYGTMTGMAADLAALPDGATGPDGFAIERVRDVAGLERWRQAYVAGFEMDPGEARPLFDFFAGIGFADDAPFRHYAGTLDGGVVASATLSLGEDAAGLWHVSTLPAVRNRGIGRAMSFAAMRDGRDAGHERGVLFASGVGVSVYARLGFQTHCQLTPYVRAAS